MAPKSILYQKQNSRIKANKKRSENRYQTRLGVIVRQSPAAVYGALATRKQMDVATTNPALNWARKGRVLAQPKDSQLFAYQAAAKAAC